MTRQEIIAHYTDVLTRLDEEAKAASSYGGHVRKTKGKLLEDLTEAIVRLAWEDAGGEPRRLSTGDTRTFKIHVRPEYVAGLPGDLRRYIERHLAEHYYRAQVDKHVFVDGKFVLGIECKAYTENAMLKRILFDFMMLRSLHAGLACCLLQMESMLGGQYSDPLASPQLGSPSTHALMSIFPDLQLQVLTLLDGPRYVERPIHKPKYFKELRPAALDHTIGKLRTLLEPFV